MPPQVNIFLLLFGGMQAALLSILLVKRGQLLPGRYFLTAYLIVMTGQIILKVMSKIWLMETMRPLYSFSYQLPFLYGPLIYLFMREVTGKGTTGRKAVLHFIPGILVAGCLVFGIPHKQVPFLLEFFFHPLWSMILQLVSLFIYHGFAVRYLQQYVLNFSRSPSATMVSRSKWLRQFVMTSLLVCSSVAIVICLMYIWFPHYQELRFGFSVLTIFIYWISYSALSEPEIFGVIKGYGRQGRVQEPVSMFAVHHAVKKYSNSGLREEDLHAIIHSAENRMQQDKLYLHTELTIDELASAIGCPRHHLSQGLNDKLGKSFYDYTNHYRVEEAKTLLTDPAKAAYKIASVAYDAGFNSISTFNDVFKKSTGLTPSQFRKQQEEKGLRKQRI